MRLLNIKSQLNIEDLLSSRTYPTQSFNKCIYCHKDVENDYFSFDGHYFQPYRCNCKNARKELLAKENLLNELTKLDKSIDVNSVNNETKQYEINKINRKYKE